MGEQVSVLRLAPEHGQPRLRVLDHRVAALREADLRAVVDDRRAGRAHEQRRGELQPALVATGHPQEPVHVVVVEQRREPEPGELALVLVHPAGEGRDVGGRLREGIADHEREVEVEDGVQASGVAREPVEVPGRLAEHEGVGLDLAQTGAKLDPEGRVGARHVVAAHAVRAVGGDPVPRGLDEVGADPPAAGVELGQDDVVVEAAVVVRPLPEAIELGRLAALLDRVSEQMVAAPGVVGDEVEQHAQAPLVRGGDKTPQRRFAAVAWLDGKEVLVVVPVVGGRLVDGSEPDRVAAEPGDVVEVLADAGEGASIQRGRGARLRQRAVGPGEAVDHQLVDDRVVDPVWRAVRARPGELLAAGPGICV